MNLIDRIRITNEGAANFLSDEIKFDVSFIKSCTTLSQAFCWADMPQGHDYWSGVENQIQQQNDA